MKLKLSLFSILLSLAMYAQQNKLWKKVELESKSTVVKRTNEAFYKLELDAFKKALTTTLNRSGGKTSETIISFPNVEGTINEYKIQEYSIMHPDLALKYPTIKSYKGVNINDQLDHIYFSISDNGLQSMSLTEGKKDVFITPVKNQKDIYKIYNRGVKENEFFCSTVDALKENSEKNHVENRNADDAILRTYRIAISVTGQYTAYHGGTRALALAAVNATMTRVNAVFEKDFNVRLQLIANTEDVIYLDSATDPYSGGRNLNRELQRTLTREIGEANYDIGHLFTHARPNGNAGCIGCVCQNGRKGSGYSAHDVPEGDNFDIDYVCHEIGHQFGANHTWTHRGSERTGVQMEPGTGSTIMGYAGIGGNANVQLHSDPYFHAASIRQVTNVIKRTRCQVDVNTGNNVPVVNAGNDYTIPKGTPFVLSGEANDADVDDELTYCWEQVDDNRGGNTFPSPRRTRGVAFRSYEPTRNNKRYFPNLSIIKQGSTSWKWEALADVARTYNFRLTVRDNRDNGSTNNSDDVEINVVEEAGPFLVNYPSDENITWNVGGSEWINWDVAGTDVNGVNATHVDILMSTDGGDTYPVILAENVVNNGAHHIRVPNHIGSNNRIMIRGRDHIFFDISNHNFNIEPAIACVAQVPQNLRVSNIEGTSAQLSWTDVPSAVIRVSFRRVGDVNYRVIRTSNDRLRLTGLQPNTEYEVKIKSRCRGGGAAVDSDFTNTIRFRTTHDYCSLESENADGFITNFELGTIANPSRNSVYTNYNHLSTNLRKGIEHELRITVNRRSAFARYRYIVWIDYNRDGDFEDANERVISTDRIRDNNISENFTIPNNVNNGYAKMRVAMVEGNTGPCGTFFAGEVEDYAIQITSIDDNEVPVITLNGNAVLEVEAGSNYIDAGATALDNVDGDITGAIVVANNVDTSVLGVYQVTYNVVDSSGNNAIEVIRTVRVVDTQIPVITLNGNAVLEVEAGSNYVDAGATAVDNLDGNITGAIVVANNVNTSVLGTYQITYNVVDSSGNNAVEVVRTVRVIDTQIPVIILNGNVMLEVEAGSNYVDAGATAVDNLDGNITGAIVVANNVNTSVLGTYQITYNVVDSSGNNAVEVIRTIRVVDTQIPVITLNGNAIVEVEVGANYVDAGATATDNLDGNITGAIVVANNVDTAALGTYQVIYNVVDSSGNNAVEVVRTVRVVDTQIPVITLNGNAIIEVEAGSNYLDAGATAVDNLDGDITGAIVLVNNIDTSTLGTYQVTYNVADSSGNSAVEVVRTIRVVDTRIPVITLNGNEIEEIEFGGTYNELGATAFDSLDGDITNQIITSGNVNTNITGTYSVTYNVTDSSGNNAVEVVRLIKVKSKKIIVFPNPVENDFVQIVFPEEEANYFISDSLGKKITEGSIKDGEKINLEHLGTGIYHINLLMKSRVKTIKIIKK
ncbi:immunoglobulin-like domain-containing protein [Tenacibaculum amylolyticum]|uniref:immunoglobulin-like domain-containing protein n=1 Tax=Tenacibaculum amylolyticum TaxID=104269 RepID=UPI003892F455